MTIETIEALYLEESGVLSLGELVEHSGLSEQELRELIESGAFAPQDTRSTTWTFGSWCVVVARRAYRLREEFALDDMHSLAVVLRFEQRIEALEDEIKKLRART
jgi:chaperone modulatory protein CbpM